jgi:hypothetical protein
MSCLMLDYMRPRQVSHDESNVWWFQRVAESTKCAVGGFVARANGHVMVLSREQILVAFHHVRECQS